MTDHQEGVSKTRVGCRRWSGHILCMCLSLCGHVTGQAADPVPSDSLSSSSHTPATPPALRERRSRHLVLWTDLSSEEAERAIQSLERTLAAAEKYWGRDQRGQIICYLIRDLENLQERETPHRLARIVIGHIGGATFTTVSRGGEDHRFQSTVFASAAAGVAEHEIVHAYCSQTHGFTGPDWYKDGMAEMVVRRCNRESGVICSPEQIAELQNQPLPSVQEVLDAGGSGTRLVESLQIMLSDPKNQGRNIPLSDWKQQDTAQVAMARREYLRSWAFCYLLLHNPNYSTRFRMLGQHYVTDPKTDFQQFFAPVQREIAFEYAFFLRHIGMGYRVDLCRWDWGKQFHSLKQNEPRVCRVAAARGFQASGLRVIRGESYAYQTQGNWAISCNKSGTPDLRKNQPGGLAAVILHDYQLSEPVSLDEQGVFEAPASGDLYLRCNESFTDLSDNRGSIDVRFSRP